MIPRIKICQVSTQVFINEVYGLYSNYNSKIKNEIQQAKMLSSLDHQNLYGFNADIKDVWNGVINYTQISVKNMIELTKKIPGLDSIKDTQDFPMLIDYGYVDFFLVHFIFLFFNLFEKLLVGILK